MTTPKATFETPPSEHNVANVIQSQSRAMYLNKPKYHKEEDDTEAAEAPVDEGQPDAGKTSTSDSDHDWKKRYSDLKSYADKQANVVASQLDEKDRLLAEKDKALEEALKQPVKMPATPEELKEFQAKFGHLDKILESKMIMKAEETKNELSKIIKENEKNVQMLHAEKAKQQLLEAHPDAGTLKTNPDFIDWLNSQIPAIRALIDSSRVDEVSRGLDIYKKDKGLVKSKQQKIKEQEAAAQIVPTNSAVEVGGNRGKVWTASEVHAIPMSKYHLYAAEIEKAYSEGRYDPNR